MKELYIIIAVFLFIIILLFINSTNETFQNGENIKTTPTLPIISYWYKYLKSDTRSKCFDCDKTSKYRHGSNCFDCEIKGGRSIDPELNRVLTR